MPATARFDRQEALTKARDLFWRQGFHATSLKDIESALSLRPGSIYAAFQSKEGLFLESLAHYAKSSRALAQATFESAKTPLDGLIAHVRRLGETSRRCDPSRACMLVKTLLEAQEDAVGARQLAETELRETEALFEAQFRRAHEAGQIDQQQDAARLARRYQANVIGLTTFAQRGGPDDGLQDLVEDIVQEIERLRQ